MPLLDARRQGSRPAAARDCSPTGDLRSPRSARLAAYDDPKTPAVILDGYAGYGHAEKRDALNTLAARPAYATALLDAVAAKKIPATDLSADLVRQLRNLSDDELDKRIAEVWGIVRDDAGRPR